jgi:hypothetical protein
VIAPTQDEDDPPPTMEPGAATKRPPGIALLKAGRASYGANAGKLTVGPAVYGPMLSGPDGTIFESATKVDPTTTNRNVSRGRNYGSEGDSDVLKVTMMLADHAAAVDGKLYINGGGWSVTGPAPMPGAIAMAVSVPWDEREEEHSFLLELLDADGHPVLVPTPQGVQPLRIEGGFKLDGPFDVKPGTPLDGAFAFNYAPIPLAPGSRYEWRLTVDDRVDEDWTLPFSTRAAQPEAA